jgi:myo-inositol-1(or 4)-monophosphatase
MGEYSVILDAAKEVARDAGALLRDQYFKAGEVFFKGEVNLVTETDMASQALIHRRLAERFPDHDFLAEEGLAELHDAEFRWVFDPLDGTTNFAHRFPVFCVSLAMEHRGRPACGVVFNPMSDEMFWGERGGGAFLNGTRIRVSAISDLNRALLATGFSYDIRETKANMSHHDNFLLRSQAVRRCGSAAIDLCYVACGRFDGFWEMKLNPWDTAAGAVIVEEAGGRISDFQDRPVNIYHPEVLATNGLVHQAMLDILNGDRIS